MLKLEQTSVILNMPLTHSAVGICTPFCPGQKRPLLTVVFLCPSKIISTGLIRIKFFMVGCVMRLSSRSFLDDSANLMQPASNDFALKRGGLKSNPGETAMRNNTQKPTCHVSLKSIFLLLDSDKNLITSSLTFEQVKPLSEHINGSIIKFQAMVRLEVLS